jgi:hypothetical protein
MITAKFSPHPLSGISMIDLAPLFEFSCSHCTIICAVLVPANLLATLQTMILAALDRPSQQIGLMAGVAGCYAAVMVLHVAIWFWIGVIMPPTFILLALALVCLGINSGLTYHPEKMAELVRWGYPILRSQFFPLASS